MVVPHGSLPSGYCFSCALTMIAAATEPSPVARRLDKAPAHDTLSRTREREKPNFRVFPAVLDSAFCILLSAYRLLLLGPLRGLPVPAVLAKPRVQLGIELSAVARRHIGFDIFEFSHPGDNRAHRRVHQNKSQRQIR